MHDLMILCYIADWVLYLHIHIYPYIISSLSLCYVYIISVMVENGMMALGLMILRNATQSIQATADGSWTLRAASPLFTLLPSPPLFFPLYFSLICSTFLFFCATSSSLLQIPLYPTTRIPNSSCCCCCCSSQKPSHGNISVTKHGIIQGVFFDWSRPEKF